MTDAVHQGRIATLDGLRGLAVMGILLMNVTAFALPEGAYFNPAAYGAGGADDYVVWGVMSLLVDGKMRGLFSLLFGASMLLVVERANAAGESGVAVHYRRMAVLLLFGLAHNYLIWWGDILLHYAVIGCLALAFVDRSPGALVRIGIALFALQLLIGGTLIWGFAQWRDAALAPGAGAELVRGWLAVQGDIGVATPARLAAELATYRGPWSGIVHDLAVTKRPNPLVLLYAGGAETLGLMLFGMAGLKSGFLTGAWPRATYRRVALGGYAVGLAGSAALIAIDVRSGFDSLTVFGASFVGGTPFRPFVMAGHAALALLWLTGGEGGLRPFVIAAGRVAFTNYLGTSLTMTFLFYGWGLGLFGTIGRAELYLLVPVAWVAMLAWPRPWLARHPHGPLEWLWRSAARGRWQAWRRPRAA